MSAQTHHLDLSPALQAAQARLLQARAALQQQRAATAPTVGQNAVLSDDAETAVSPHHQSHVVSSQIERRTHKIQDTLAKTTRNWHLENAQRYVQNRQRLAGIQVRDRIADDAETAISTATRWMENTRKTAVSHPPTLTTDTTNPQTVRHCPSLGVAAIKEGRVPAYLVWLACRALDHQGRGWLDMKRVKQALTGKKSPLRLFGWRRLRQVLHEGEGDFWKWEGNACTEQGRSGRLWLRSTARVAHHLNVERLQGRQVILPVSALTSGISTFKAHLYASWHSGRRRPAPVSRTVQHTLTGVPERTQRHYCRVAAIPRQQNIAIGPKHTEQSEQEAIWRHGRGTFSFIDVRGEQGRRNGRYIAWQLPTTHGTIHRTKRGNQKRINRKLKDLAQTRGQGNSSESIERIYYPSSEAAVREWRKRPLQDRYWQAHSPPRRRSAAVWYALLKNE